MLRACSQRLGENDAGKRLLWGKGLCVVEGGLSLFLSPCLARSPCLCLYLCHYLCLRLYRCLCVPLPSIVRGYVQCYMPFVTNA